MILFVFLESVEFSPKLQGTGGKNYDLARKKP
jgi:hypothetical protein